MFRNSTLYRRIWYAKRRRTKSLHIFIRLVFIFIILTLFVVYAQKKAIPNFLVVSEYKARAVISEIIDDTVVRYKSGEFDYNSILSIDKDKNGKIVSIQPDMPKMNAISSQISEELSEGFARIKAETFKMPLGVLLESRVFGSVGPDISFKMAPADRVEVTFNSQLLDCGANQAAIKIYLHIRVKTQLLTPFAKKWTEITEDIPVTEKIIIAGVSKVY